MNNIKNRNDRTTDDRIIMTLGIVSLVKSLVQNEHSLSTIVKNFRQSKNFDHAGPSICLCLILKLIKQ